MARTCSAENTWLEHTLREHAKRNLNTQKTWHGCVLQRTHDWGTHIENIPSATLTHIENMAGVCSAENTWLGHTHWEHVQCNLNTHRKHGRGVFYREHMTRAHTFRTCPAQPQHTQKAWQGRVLQNTWAHTFNREHAQSNLSMLTEPASACENDNNSLKKTFNCQFTYIWPRAKALCTFLHISWTGIPRQLN